MSHPDAFRVQRFLAHALEGSVYAAPDAPGLTNQELFEIGERLGLKEGEIADTFKFDRRYAHLDGRLVPGEHAIPPAWQMSGSMDDSGCLNPAAFRHIRSELYETARLLGNANARLEAGLIIARGEHKGILAHDIKVALAAQLISGTLNKKGGLVGYAHDLLSTSMPEREPELPRMGKSTEKEHVIAIVRDVVRRRGTALPLSIEPFGAFAERLAGLNYGPFKLWWQRTVSELNRLDEGSTPVAITVLSAALVEGALTFVVRHARKLGLGTLASKDFDREPNTWKIDDLVRSAAAGQSDAVLTASGRAKAEALIRSRQQIHAGRMLVDYPQGAPDFRPEEAREAKAAAESIVRQVLDWLDKHPDTKN